MAKPKDVDAYIAAAPAEARATLEAVRDVFRSALPGAEERIAWGVPIYRVDRDVGGFAVYTRHVSVGLARSPLPDDTRAKLEECGYKTGKRTVQVRFDQKVPVTAIGRLLRAAARESRATLQR
ncbi:MAG TPA: DUF1801 domain-containing protein [Gaiellaceae bacterium]|nr:DUF1801 domain-containing protein [Gaiellaceae bacterium]